MWYIDRSREQLMELFHSGNLIDDTYIEGQIWKEEYIDRSGFVRLVWPKPPLDSDLPSLILIPKEEIQEFFAWVNTYLPGWRPISSLIRIMSSEVRHQIDGSWSISRPLRGFENGALGLVLSEALTHTGAGNSRMDGLMVSTSACMATCSFSIGRWIGLGRKFTSGIGQNWFYARKILDQSTLGFEPQTVLAPWSVLSEIGGSGGDGLNRRSVPSAVLKMCEKIHATGLIDNGSLATITKGWPDLRGAFQQMEGPWERRVVILEQALRATMQKRKSLPDSIVFGCGLLASRVAPGTLDHASLLLPYLPHAKGLLLWYGLCAGLVQGSRLMDFSENLGRRVLRDMLAEESVFARPRCDISLEELKVLSVATSSISNLRTSVSGRLSIEISPCVTTSVRWPSGERRKMDSQRALFNQDAVEVGSIVRELSHTLDRVRRRLKDIQARG